MRKLVGAVLVALPFVGVFAYGTALNGAVATLWIFVGIAIMIYIIYLGVSLLGGS